MGEPKLLIVDDEPTILNLMRKVILLIYKGAEVDTAVSAQEAQQAAVDDRYDAILSDIEMPGKSGIDLVLNMRAQKPSPTIVLMTGNPILMMQAFQVGAYSCLGKPIPGKHLVNVLRRAVEYHGLQRHLEGYRRALRSHALMNQKTTEDILARVKEVQRRMSGMRRLEKCQSGLIAVSNDETARSAHQIESEVIA